jgi:hypothetical protein
MQQPPKLETIPNCSCMWCLMQSEITKTPPTSPIKDEGINFATIFDKPLVLPPLPSRYYTNSLPPHLPPKPSPPSPPVFQLPPPPFIHNISNYIVVDANGKRKYHQLSRSTTIRPRKDSNPVSLSRSRLSAFETAIFNNKPFRLEYLKLRKHHTRTGTLNFFWYTKNWRNNGDAVIIKHPNNPYMK